MYSNQGWEQNESTGMNYTGQQESMNMYQQGQGQQQQQPMETVALDTPGQGRGPTVTQLPPQDLITEILTNKVLRVPKAFYFFFFAAFGSLFPLMAVYFKQLGMNPVQTGFLIGIRPFIEIFSAPFWSSLADKFQKGKLMLMASLFSWIVFTCSLAFIRPPASACVIFNATHHVMYTPYMDEYDDQYEESVVEKGISSNLEVKPFVSLGTMNGFGTTNSFGVKLYAQTDYMSWQTKNSVVQRRPLADEKPRKKSIFWDVDPKLRHKAPPGHVVGMSPVLVDYTLNYNKDKHASYVSPSFSTVVYKLEDVKEVFFLLLLLVLLGEFFSAPAITLADSATLSYLGDNTDLYGRQRTFGSVGWALAMFIVGMALDGATDFPNHPCGPHERERNYKVCFTYFAILMILALAVASQFQFQYEGAAAGSNFQEGVPMTTNLDASKPRPIFNTAPPINPPPGLNPNDSKFEFIDKWKSAVFAQRSKQLPEWMSVLKIFANVRYGLFLFVVWFMGLGIGLVFAFLFWHLQDLGGTPTLFGVASVINHVSEIVAYFYSLHFIKELGHTRVLCIGLGGNVARFLYIAVLSNSWWVLPFELIQGITHATVWAACCSYITQATEPKLRSSTQAVLQALHHGLGRGCGAIIGGYFINLLGTRITFATYGLLSGVVLGMFVLVNYKKSEDGTWRWHEDDIAMEVTLEDGGALAPHGVPSAPVHRNASKVNLQSMDTITDARANGDWNQDSSRDPYSEAGWGDTRGGYGGPGLTNYQTAQEFHMKSLVTVNPLTELILQKRMEEELYEDEASFVMATKV